MAQSLVLALGGASQVVTTGGKINTAPVSQNPGMENNVQRKGNVVDEETKRIYEKVNDYIEKNQLNEKVIIKKDTRGVLIELQDRFLFDPGNAALKQEGYPLLEKISGLLYNLSNEVIVEGHTDNLPINSGYYQSNWELSTDRAIKVVRYFVEKAGIDGRRFQAAGCGEFKPIDTNSTPEGRQKNRRVDILIVTTN